MRERRYYNRYNVKVDVCELPTLTLYLNDTQIESTWFDFHIDTFFFVNYNGQSCDIHRTGTYKYVSLCAEEIKK